MIFALLVAYQIKHFLADYLLQGKYMLKKFSPGWEFFGPLAAHCTVHGLFTFVIAMIVLGGKQPWLIFSLVATDWIIHFFMDRVKAGPKYLGQFKAMSSTEFVENSKEMVSGNVLRNIIAKEKVVHNTIFWYSLGLDQMVHHLTHYYIIWRLVNG